MRACVCVCLCVLSVCVCVRMCVCVCVCAHVVGGDVFFCLLIVDCCCFAQAKVTKSSKLLPSMAIRSKKATKSRSATRSLPTRTMHGYPSTSRRPAGSKAVRSCCVCVVPRCFLSFRVLF